MSSGLVWPLIIYFIICILGLFTDFSKRYGDDGMPIYISETESKKHFDENLQHTLFVFVAMVFVAIAF